MIGGDFNVRIGNDKNKIYRKSKDKTINTKGKIFLEEVGKKRWDILNENIDGDEEEEFTYIGAREKAIIDYTVTNTETRKKIDKLIVENKTESDYLPICVYLQLENEFKAAEDSFQHNTQMQQI